MVIILNRNWNGKGKQVFPVPYTLKLLSNDFLFLFATNKFYINFQNSTGCKINNIDCDRACGWQSGLVTKLVIADHCSWHVCCQVSQAVPTSLWKVCFVPFQHKVLCITYRLLALRSTISVCFLELFFWPWFFSISLWVSVTSLY